MELEVEVEGRVGEIGDDIAWREEKCTLPSGSSKARVPMKE